MTWTEVADRLAEARTYWLGSTTASGAPHAAPVWGVVTGETLYLYSERSTVKARNLASDPRVVVHLESGEDVLIVRGVAEDLGPPAEVPSVVSALAAKYTGPQDQQYLPDHDPDFDVVYALRPRAAMAWRLDDYEGSQRRWSAVLWWKDMLSLRGARGPVPGRPGVARVPDREDGGITALRHSAPVRRGRAVPGCDV